MRQVKLITEISQALIDHGSESLERRINRALADGWSLVGVQIALSTDGDGGWICVQQATLEAEVEPADDRVGGGGL